MTVRNRPRGLSAQSGQVVVFFALLLPVLLGLGSVVVSVGNWYVHKRHLQTQVDAGAFAGAQAFTGCFLQDQQAQENANIAAAALNYAGDTRRDPATRNLEVQTPDDVYVALNSTSYWQSSNGTDPNVPSSGYGLDYTDHVDAKGNATADGYPCTTRKLDVKATDDRAPNIFHWIPLTPSPKARAQVAVWKEAGESGFLPWAVPEARPKRVAALWVDEAGDGAQQPAWTWLTGPADPSDTTLHNGEQTAQWQAVDNVDITDQTGMVVLQTRRDLQDADLAGKSLAEICAMTNVTCFGSIKGIGTTAQSGIGFVQGYPQTDGSGTTAVTLSESELTISQFAGPPVSPSAGIGCPDTNFGDSAPYFIWTDADCDVRIRAHIEFGSGIDASSREVFVSTSPIGINGGKCGNGTQLKKENESGQVWWEQEAGWTTIAAGSGRNEFYLCWDGKTVVGNSKVAGNFGGRVIQMAFAANTDIQEPNTEYSGPIVYASLTPGHSLATGSQSVQVTIGLQPPLRLSDPNARPIFLRIAGKGSLNQMLDCDPSPIGPVEEVHFGCVTPYQVNTRNLRCAPDPNDPSTAGEPTWDQNNLPPTNVDPDDPATWPDCIEGNPGDVTSMSKGIHQRWEINADGSTFCPPNNWQNIAAGGDPTGDPRFVTLIVADYGAFAGQGQNAAIVPITMFAGFYVTGWFVAGGAQGTNGCPGLPPNEANDLPPSCPDPNNPSGALCDPSSQKLQGAVWGYFVKQTHLTNAVPGPELCEFNELGQCVARLVK